MSLLAMVMAITVMGLVSAGWARRQLISSEQTAGASLGYTLNQVALAIDNYRGANLATLVTASPAVSGVANPMTPTLAELQTTGYLNSAISTILPDGNSYRISINKTPAGCVGPSATCNVYSVLSLVNPVLDISTGHPSIQRLSALLGAVQDSASFSVLPNPAQITGGNGGWTVANPDAAARVGIVVVVAGLGGTGTQWLRVGDPRDPNFMGNETVNGYIKPSGGAGQTVTAGTACTEPAGAIRNDGAGRILSCQGGLWTAGDGSKSAASAPPQNNVPGGASFAVDTCAAGGTPWASYTAQTSATNIALTTPYQVVTYSVSQSGANWVTLTQALAPPAAPVTVNSNASLLGVIPQGVFTRGCSY